MTDKRAQYTEEAVGANHPTKQDVVNRLALVEHNTDGTHKILRVIGWGIMGAPTVGTKVVPAFIMRSAASFAEVYVYADTAPVGADLIFDLNVNGSTIWSTQGNRVKILANAHSGVQTTFDTTALAIGDRIDVDVDQIGSSTPGSNITIEITLVP